MNASTTLIKKGLNYALKHRGKSRVLGQSMNPRCKNHQLQFFHTLTSHSISNSARRLLVSTITIMHKEGTIGYSCTIMYKQSGHTLCDASPVPGVTCKAAHTSHAYYRLQQVKASSCHCQDSSQTPEHSSLWKHTLAAQENIMTPMTSQTCPSSSSLAHTHSCHLVQVALHLHPALHSVPLELLRRRDIGLRRIS